MIIPDINLLIYAYNEGAPHHQDAKHWWEARMNGTDLIGIPWAVSLGFIRLMTHRRVLEQPISPESACHIVGAWFERSQVRILNPGPKHFSLLQQLLEHTGIAGKLTTDAHLAALTLEYQGELHSNDNDFARFPGLRWVNPLANPRDKFSLDVDIDASRERGKEQSDT